MDSALINAAMDNTTADLEPILAGLADVVVLTLLLIACSHNSVDYVRVVMRMKSGLAWRRNEEGQSAVHIACEKGHVEIVEVLLDGNPRLCHLTDNRGMTPLHIATEKGNIGLMKRLLKACPQSLDNVTVLRETALLLAAKNDQIGAFQLLMEEAVKRKQENLIHFKDVFGDNCFHVAVVRNQVQILRLLLVDNPKRCALVRVNSRNAGGFTALDLHFQNITEDTEIYQLLHSAGARQAHSDPPKQASTTSPHRHTSFSKLSVLQLLLMVLILVAGSTYTSIFNLHDDDVALGVIGVREAALHPHLLPPVFYSIVFMTFAFAASMAGVAISLWSAIKGWPFCFQVLPSLGLATFFLSYFFILIAKVPKFSVTITDEESSVRIQSFWLVWLCCLVLGILLGITGLVAKMIVAIFWEPSQPEDLC